MTIRPLTYLSEAILQSLRASVPVNLQRYTEGNFNDLASTNGWGIEARAVTIDTDRLAQLECGATSPEVEVANSLLVHDALQGMTPSLAAEERVWVRLSHVEGLEYARSRWLAGVAPERAAEAVEAHFFARTLTRTRDDHAIGRLWWNAAIARMADPADPAAALRLILKSADIRSNFVERTRMVSRPVLARAILRIMRADPWVVAGEANFRTFMKVLNREGGGILFEMWPDARVDEFMARCSEGAKAMVSKEPELEPA